MSADVLRPLDRVASRLPPGGRRAGWFESRLWLAVSPLAFVGLRAGGTRPVVRLGRFGTLVNDPVLGRRILTDPDRFRTVGPGTHGELMDLAIGPDALLNMDGPAHEALRRELGPLFSPAASAALVAETAAGPIEEAAARLRDGEPGGPRPARPRPHRTDDVRAPRCPAAGRRRRGVPRLVPARRGARGHDGPRDPSGRAARRAGDGAGARGAARRAGTDGLGDGRRDDRPPARARVRLGGGASARRRDRARGDRDGDLGRAADRRAARGPRAVGVARGRRARRRRGRDRGRPPPHDPHRGHRPELSRGRGARRASASRPAGGCS